MKKGIIKKETIELILSALVIVAILIPLGYMLFKIFGGSNDEEQAREILRQVYSRINSIEQTETYSATGPRGWVLKVEDINNGRIRTCKLTDECIDEDCCECEDSDITIYLPFQDRTAVIDGCVSIYLNEISLRLREGEEIVEIKEI